MKKIVSLLTFTLLLAGCAREAVPGTGEAFRTESLRASIVETRVEVDDLGKFSWTAGDQIAVHRSASGYETATLTEDGLFNVHLEDGEDRDAFAIYPARLADESHSSASDLAVILPNAYTIPVDGMGEFSPVPMVANNKPESEDVQFHHLGGILRLSLDCVPYETQKISVNLGKRVTGSFFVTNPASSAPSISLDEGTAEDIVFTLESPLPSTVDGFNLNIPLPKGSYNGVSLKIYDRYDNLVCEKMLTMDFTVGRAQGIHSSLDNIVDVTRIPLCVKMARHGTVTVSNPRGLTLEYSLDNETWTAFSSNLSLDLDQGELVYFRGENAAYGSLDVYGRLQRETCTRILSTAKCYLYGNIMSLINPDPEVFSSLTELTAPYTFSNMFCDSEDINLVTPLICSHPSIDLVLPATTLADFCYCCMFEKTGIDRMTLPAMTMKQSCYASMFAQCWRIEEAPALPAMTLAQDCYNSMFYECRNLTAAPALPATTLAQTCYGAMFSGCDKLEAAPALPATTLAQSCYRGMFSECKSLAVAPALPATTLAESCYERMFSFCSSLIAAPSLPATTLAQSCYYRMFSDCTSLVAAPVLPATTLAQLCYYAMFAGCRSLTTASDLPATSLANQCYGNMFTGCASLATAPALPATTMAPLCYSEMFSSCSNLTTAPVLPADLLEDRCYYKMFTGCSSLATAPELPATSLAHRCYEGMFSNCLALTTAPDLPATTLTSFCYENMFKGCNSLNYVKAMFTGGYNSGCFIDWLSGVSSTGTYVMNAAATYDPKAEAGVPAGWTIERATE